MKPALEQAEKSGATVIVVAPKQKEAEKAAANTFTIKETVQRAVFRFRLLWEGSHGALADMRETLVESSPDGTISWLLKALVAGLIAVVAGRLLAKPVAVWLGNTFAPRTN